MAGRNTNEPKKASRDAKNSTKHPEQQEAEQEEARTRREEREETGEAQERQPQREDAEESGAEESDEAQERQPQREDAEKSGEASEAETADEPASREKRPERLPVVGVGASAGGLEALEALVAKLPEDSGIAFVIISHTHPKHKTRLPELLEKKTKAEVRTITDGMELARGIVYIPPSDRDPVLEDGVFRLQKRQEGAAVHMPVDTFLRSLARERGEHAGCVILSGSGSDGTLGVRAIKEKAGVAVVQAPESARHAGMPESAIDTGLVDFILAPERIAEQLIEYYHHPAEIHFASEKEESRDRTSPPGHLEKILKLLEQKTDHDFSQYKKSTLIRRIERRMSVTRSKDVPAYLELLHQRDDEVKALFQNLLIGVTSFFRDPEVFSYLKKEVVCEMVTRSEKDTLRVWVPGCATGEEAYSVIMLFKECMEEHNTRREVQVFATDIDPRAIEKARHGYYPENIATDVSQERLERFFISESNGYRVKKEIREPVVFAEQNLLRDPPFLNIDLLVCRNLLIYLEPQVQKRLIPLFHYALNGDGFLFLGPSESVGDFSDLFQPFGKKHNIFKKQRTKRDIHPNIQFSAGGVWQSHGRDFDWTPKKQREPSDESVLSKATERMLLHEYAPATVVTTMGGDILYIHGSTGKYLEPATGKANLQIKEMARDGLRFRLSSALRRAAEEGVEAREDDVQVKTNGDFVRLDVIVRPFSDRNVDDCLMIVFKEKPLALEKARQAREESEDGVDHQRVVELEQELAKLQRDYRSAVEELETSNEELRSLNEEMNSSNEELQSTNEELESSREELQSLNEELNTVNVELQNKIQETEEAYAAISEVLNSTHIALLFLDRELRVERFTKEASELVNLIDKDVGRSLGDISNKLEGVNLGQRVRKVLDTLNQVDEEVRTEDGDWYRMRILVRRSNDHQIDGVVITFVNIDAQKEAMRRVEESERRFRALTEASSEVLYRMSPKWEEMQQLHNRGFLSEVDKPIRDWQDKFIPEDEQERVQAAIDEAIAGKSVFVLKHRIYRQDGSVAWAFSRAVPLLDENGEISEWYGAASDITASMEEDQGGGDES